MHIHNHTPVPAGHDQFALSALATTLGFRAYLSDVFDPDMVVRVFGRHEPPEEKKSLSGREAMLNMTYLGLNMSRYVNGVAKLNTPQPPLEVSGTSGMKAALNGIPSLSIVDGWWMEGLIEGRVGDWQ